MKNRDFEMEFKQTIAEGFKANDPEMVSKGFEQLFEAVREEAKAEMEGAKLEADRAVLAQRGSRQLTSEEHAYYEALGGAMKASNPQQALVNAGVTMPITIIDAVFEELSTNHPLLSKIDFQRSYGNYRLLMASGEVPAVWGAMCAEITKELTGTFKEVDGALLKLSAFIPVCKGLLELGADYLDRFVRTILVEALAAGLENGIVNGNGKDQPIGMTRDVSASASVVGGVQPLQTAEEIEDFSPATMGALVAKLATMANGEARNIRPEDLILVVNPFDYYTKIMPATTVLTQDGKYVRDVFPVPVTVIPSSALTANSAVIGLASKYFCAIGMDKDGKIEYSDEYQFLEDNRVYKIKLYANGLPKDENAFILLDISGVGAGE